MITAEPAGGVAAILEPLRGVADEILIAADARVDDATLAGYATVADVVRTIEYVRLERHLGWLHAQCRSEWILHLDGDELPSAALVERLPELLASRTVAQYAIAQAWSFPDPRHVLDEPPWSADFHNRLVRNRRTLRFTGATHVHAEPEQPLVHIPEPVYHLDLLANALPARRAKAVRYEVMRPHLTAVGGGRLNEAFYLPELRPAVARRVVPAIDAQAIQHVLDAPAPPAGGTVPAAAREVVPLAELDRYWAGRVVPESAYRATVEPYESVHRLAPAQHAEVFVHVTNDGTERWPASLDALPAIRLGSRWASGDGTTGSEGPRIPLPVPLEPGERVLAPVAVVAPGRAGDYVLEVDVVHEDVRWFGRPGRLEVSVGEPESLPPVGARLRPTRRPRVGGLRRLRIPQTFHRVWLGPAAMPEQERAFGETLTARHPGFELREWTDADLGSLDLGEEEVARARSWAELSNLVRYEILSRHGGIYVDTDVECRRPFVDLLRGVEAFAGLEGPGRVGTAVLGSRPGHPAFRRAALEARATLGLGAHSADANGPYFLTLLLEQEPGVTIFDAGVFYPYRWDEPERKDEAFPDAYAVHHWAQTWTHEEAPGLR